MLLRGTKKKGKISFLQYPFAIEMEYNRKFQKALRIFPKLINPWIKKYFPLFRYQYQNELKNDSTNDGIKIDEWLRLLKIVKLNPNNIKHVKLDNGNIKLDGWLENANRLLQVVKLNFVDTLSDSMNYNYFSYIGEKENKWHVKQWRTLLASAYGVEWFKNEPWVAPLIKDFAKNNVTLIKNLTDQAFEEVDRVVKLAVRNQYSNRTIQQMLLRTSLEPLKVSGYQSKKSVYHKLKKRAELIAVDQTGKFNSLINEERQQKTGFKGYQWLTVKDERVRGRPGGRFPNAKPSHWARQNKYYLWTMQRTIPPGYEKELPSDGHPGYPYRCRCVPKPDLRWIFVDDFGELQGKEKI